MGPETKGSVPTVFRLAELMDMYFNCLAQLGMEVSGRVHSTEKNRLISTDKIHNFNNLNLPTDFVNLSNKGTNYIPTSEHVKTSALKNSHKPYTKQNPTKLLKVTKYLWRCPSRKKIFACCLKCKNHKLYFSTKPKVTFFIQYNHNK